MANTLTSVIPTILTQTLPVLRQNAVLTQLSRQDFGSDAAQQGNAITIGKSVAATARAVTPGVTPATNQDITPTSVVVTLDKWYEATFQMSDKDQRELMSGILPLQGQECVKAVVNQIESDWLAAALYVGNAVGTAGTTPFATNINSVASATKILNTQLAPMSDRFAVIDPAAEANGKVTSDLLRFDGAGQNLTQISGLIGRRLGVDWFMDQNISTHTVGTAWVTGYALSTVGAAAGDTTLNVLNATASGTILVGDLFTVAGSEQVYSVQTAVSAAATTALVLTFFPALATAATTGAAITVKASYVQNVVFQRGSMAFVSRPLAPALDIGGVASSSGRIVDPISGIALTLEITREYYQSTFRVSSLYGVRAIRKEHLVHLLG